MKKTTFILIILLTFVINLYLALDYQFYGKARKSIEVKTTATNFGFAAEKEIDGKVKLNFNSPIELNTNINTPIKIPLNLSGDVDFKNVTVDAIITNGAVNIGSIEVSGEGKYKHLVISSTKDIARKIIIKITTKIDGKIDSIKNLTINLKEAKYSCDPENPLNGITKRGKDFLIISKEQLICISNYQNVITDAGSILNSRYKLMNDINFNGINEKWDLTGNNNSSGWKPFGMDLNESPDGFQGFQFTGHFNGNGHKIRGLYINRPDSDYQGFFGNTRLAKIFNLSLLDLNIKAKGISGGLIGVANDYSIINDCHTSGYVISQGNFIGGLVGALNSNSTIENSQSECTISGGNFVGGLVGKLLNYSKINSSFAKGNVSGKIYVGGLAGNINTSTINNSYANGNVYGTNSLGGLVGVSNNTGIINCSYATGSIENVNNTGGLLGLDYDGKIQIFKSYSTNRNINVLGKSIIPSFDLNNYCSPFNQGCYPSKINMSPNWDNKIWNDLGNEFPSLKFSLNKTPKQEIIEKDPFKN